MLNCTDTYINFSVLTDKTDSQGTFDLPVYYSLYDELKKILYVNKKKERIHACVNLPEFRFVFSTFRNYEVRYISVKCTVVLVVLS